MNRGVFVVMAIFFVALGMREMRRRRLERTLETTFARLEPPNDMHDAAAWDRYWEDQIDLDEEASGGKAEYVVGDLTEPEVCPGPFDVIIERRTG